MIDPPLRSFGPHGAEGGVRDGGRRTMASFGEGVFQGRDDKAACKTGFAEPDLGFGGVDVDVYAFGIAGKEQGDGGVAITA